MESLQPIDGLLASNSIVLAAIGDDAAHEQSINNCFMASQPGEAFWLFYIQAMHARAAQGFQKVSLASCWPALAAAVILPLHLWACNMEGLGGGSCLLQQQAAWHHLLAATGHAA